MVRIAVAGGTGSVASNLLYTTIRSGKHDITIFTRGNPPANKQPGVDYKTVDYNNRAELAESLRGFHTCLSFIVAHLDPNGTNQRNLIDACVDVGVKRFAPSEWFIKAPNQIPWYDSKEPIAQYLAEINKDKQVLEYCLFQPSQFMDFFMHPYDETPGDLYTFPIWIDPSTRHAIVFEGADDIPVVLTAARDMDSMVALALDDPRPWPIIGGIQGTRTTHREILALAKEVRGGEWTVEHVSREAIERVELPTKWVPLMTNKHIVAEEEEIENRSRTVVAIIARSILSGAWDVSREWNDRFPNYKPLGLEEYIRKAWEGKS
ncbi:NAD(P)-binding protein [Corynespora cassiicola Philippines]|uniref:NAD(P)-binding protein n=1 Tax=Corynespora cassiicola Philippines TaxID=1448308 RepID=A0A2T2NQ75_CORCC|nr:NAD(P)-binding protein [Corynespora cassiicola Philippines]